MNNAMVKATRLHMGRNEYPSACIVDSQSVKTTEKGGSKAMTDIKANANDVAKRLGITTTTLYAYVNVDGSVKEAGQTILTLAS